MVDMIATASDIKPLGVLHVMPDVGSRVFVEQMKARGTHVLSTFGKEPHIYRQFGYHESSHASFAA